MERWDWLFFSIPNLSRLKGAKTSEHNLMTEVGIESTGDDLLGIVLISRLTSSSVGGKAAVDSSIVN